MSREWDADTTRRIEWFAAASLPTDPFWLEGGTVVDPTLFFGQLAKDIERGPSGPRGRTGAVQMILKRLEAMLVHGEIPKPPNYILVAAPSEGVPAEEPPPFVSEVYEFDESFGDDVPRA